VGLRTVLQGEQAVVAISRCLLLSELLTAAQGGTVGLEGTPCNDPSPVSKFLPVLSPGNVSPFAVPDNG
jgi:hypothetical protein